MFSRVCTFVRVLTFFAVLFSSSALTAFAQAAPEREGFTFLVNLGVGVQNDTGIEETGVGLAGANAGIGAFVNPKLAILGRFSGTNVAYETIFGDFRQVSGVVGPTVQYWPTDKVNIEAGAGLGLWSADDQSESGL